MPIMLQLAASTSLKEQQHGTSRQQTLSKGAVLRSCCTPLCALGMHLRWCPGQLPQQAAGRDRCSRRYCRTFSMVLVGTQPP